MKKDLEFYEELESRFEDINKEMLHMYIDKNRRYSNSFAETIREYGMIVTSMRLDEKLKRLKSINKYGEDKDGDSLEDTLIDIANYCIISLMEVRANK